MGLLSKIGHFVHKISDPGGFFDSISPFETGYQQAKAARKARRALTAQERADLQAKRDAETTAALNAQNQTVAAKRSFMSNALALGGPPISGTNALALGAAGPVTSSSPGGYGGGFGGPNVLAQGGAVGGQGATVLGTPYRAKRAIIPGVTSRP